MCVVIYRLSSYITTIDGQNPSREFNDWYMPFVMQSALTTYIPILTTACFSAIAGGNDVNKSVDVVAARFKLISLMNEHIGDENKQITDESLAAVMSMTYNDVPFFIGPFLLVLTSVQLIYADKRSVMAHIQGLNSMVRVSYVFAHRWYNLLISGFRPEVVLKRYGLACYPRCSLGKYPIYQRKETAQHMQGPTT